MRITVCDQCEKRYETKREQYLGDEHFSWIVVEANWDADHGQFCSWSCLAEWSMTKAIEHKDRTEDEVHRG